ncbi:hypothetical protein Hanom_Chr14g01322371 [Helianthus anomalus]
MAISPVLRPFLPPGHRCSKSFAAFLKLDSIGPKAFFTSSIELKKDSNGSFPFTFTITENNQSLNPN